MAEHQSNRQSHHQHNAPSHTDMYSQMTPDWLDVTAIALTGLTAGLVAPAAGIPLAIGGLIQYLVRRTVWFSDLATTTWLVPPGIPPERLPPTDGMSWTDVFADRISSPLCNSPDSPVSSVPADNPALPPPDDMFLSQLLQNQVSDTFAAQGNPVTAAQSREEPQRMPFRTWFHQHAVPAHHLLIVGETGSGKTTCVRAILTQRPGKLVVVDPKDRPGKWGITAIGLTDELTYDRIEWILQELLNELKRRQKALNRGQTAFEPLTVVCDEFLLISRKCPLASDVFVTASIIGRELGVSFIALVQFATVKALGIEGEGDSRANFTWLHLGAFATRALPTLTHQPYPGVLEQRGQLHAVDTTPLHTYARIPIDPSRQWVPPQLHNIAPEPGYQKQSAGVFDDWLQNLEHIGMEGDGDSDSAALTLHTGMNGMGGMDDMDAESDGMTPRDKQIRGMLKLGLSSNAIWRALKGDRNKTLNRIKELRRELGMEEGENDQ